MKNNRAEELFAEVLEMPAGGREIFLVEACGDDAELRLEVERMLVDKSRADARFGGDTLSGEATVASDGSGQSSGKKAPTRSGKVPEFFHPITEQPGDTIGPYKLLQQIGEGGCGVVYMAEQSEPVRRRVALKVIKLGMDTRQVVARFEAERQTLALMDHPSIARVLDAGSTDTGRPYFVMELVRGIRITDFCDQQQLSTEDRLDLFIQVCSAVQHAHQKGIIHRDLKPSNVLVTLIDGKAVPKVIDFGIAKATNQQSLTDKTLFTAFEQFIGTPAYMSPEQAEMSGVDIDTRSDIYSLGVLLYELLTGGTPFDARELLLSGVEGIRRTLREREPAKPSARLHTLAGDDLTTVARARHAEPPKLLHAVRGDLDWIVLKCLDKDRGRRYETANGLAADLKRHLENEPVVARPPSSLYRLQKLIRRNRAAFAAAAAVLIALVGGIFASTWQAVRATRAEKQALVESLRAGEAEKRETQQRLRAEAEEAGARQAAYAADMELSRQALKQNNLREARQMLDRHWPEEGEEDLRGWEWRWLWESCRSGALFELGNRQNRVLQALYVDGGRSILTYEDGGAVRRVNLDSRRTETLREADEKPPRALITNSGLLCSSRDRRWIAAVGKREKDYLVRIWDLANGAPMREVAVGETRISAIALSPDGATLVTYAPDVNAATAWDLKLPDRQVPRTIRLSHAPKLLSVYGAIRYSPDGGTLAIGGAGGQVLLMDVRDRGGDWPVAGNIQIEPNSDQGVSALDFSPDGRFLACGSVFVDPRICIVDVPSRERIRFLSGHTGFVAGLAFSSDGTSLASASADQTVKVWDTGTWTERGTHLGHTDEVWSVDFSPDGEKLISGGKDRRIEIWSAATFPEREGARLSALVPPGAKRLQLSPGLGSFLGIREGAVTLSDERERPAPPELGTNNLFAFWTSSDQIAAIAKAPLEVKLWDLKSGQVETFPLESDVPADGISCDYLPLSRLLVITVRSGNSQDVNVLRWDLATRRPLSSCVFPIRDSIVKQPPCFSLDGRRMAVSRWDNVVLYDLVEGEEVITFPVPSNSGIQGIALSPDGSQLAVAQRDKPEILVKDVETGSQVTTLHGHSLVIVKLEYSPDGSRLLSNTIGSEPVKLWSTRSWEEVARFEPPEGVYYGGPQFSSDGSAILLFAYRFGRGPDGPRLFRALSMEEILALEAREGE